jgi:DNA-binding transcriptional ArsR family regulator
MAAANPHGSERGGEVFSALSDPTRRYLVETLASRGGASATALAAELPISRQAVSKHLAALGSAGLVQRHRSGRETLYELQSAPLQEAAEWLAEVGAEWDDRLARLQQLLKR